MVWPPVTMRSAPSSRKSSAMPSPAQTATAPKASPALPGALLLRPGPGGHLGVLLAHVLYLHLEQGTVGQGLGEHVAGHVGVDVHLDYLVVIHHDHAVAQGLQVAAQELRLLAVLPPHDELGAVGESNLAVGKIGEVGPLARLGALPDSPEGSTGT